MSFFLSYVFVSAIALKRNKKHPSVSVSAGFWRLTGVMVFSILLAFLLFEPLTASLSHRFYTLYQLPTEGAQETIEIRLLMWQTALKAFLAQPLLGIGVGQFRLVHLVVPELRFSPLSMYVIGLGAHNIVLTYLSQAGFVGACSLLYFMFSFLKVGLQTHSYSLSRSELCVTTSLFGILFFVFVSSLYAGAWFYSVSGMEFMLFLALTVTLERTLAARGRATSPVGTNP